MPSSTRRRPISHRAWPKASTCCLATLRGDYTGAADRSKPTPGISAARMRFPPMPRRVFQMTEVTRNPHTSSSGGGSVNSNGFSHALCDDGFVE